LRTTTKYRPLNLYFIIPFILWMITGGILLLSVSKRTLFEMVNTHYTVFLDHLMYWLSWTAQGEFITVVLLLLMIIPRFRNLWYFITATLCNVIPLLIQQSLKSWFEWPRPMNYFRGASWIHITRDWPWLMDRSFPSGHSQGAFSFFCFLSLLLPVKYRWVGFCFFIVAISVCYSRLYLAAHFFADVYVGSMIGAVGTTVIFAVMLHYRSRFFKRGDILA